VQKSPRPLAAFRLLPPAALQLLQPMCLVPPPANQPARRQLALQRAEMRGFPV
jgi:hypothetical protein